MEYLFRKTGTNRPPWKFDFPSVPPTQEESRLATCVIPIVTGVRRTSNAAYLVNSRFMIGNEPHEVRVTELPSRAPTALRAANSVYHVGLRPPLPDEATVMRVVEITTRATALRAANSVYHVGLRPPLPDEATVMRVVEITTRATALRAANSVYHVGLSPPLPEMLTWIPKFPDYVWKMSRAVEFSSFFQPAPKDLSIIAMDWLSNVPVYVWKDRLKYSNAWWHPAFQAHLFTGSDFLRAEWYSSPSLDTRWENLPSILAEFEAMASMGQIQGTNP